MFLYQTPPLEILKFEVFGFVVLITLAKVTAGSHLLHYFSRRCSGFTIIFSYRF